MGELSPRGRVLGIGLVWGCHDPVGGAAGSGGELNTGHVLAQVFSLVFNRMDRRKAEGTSKGAVRK